MLNTTTTQKKKDQLGSMEKQMRLAGQKLDALWMEARTAKGQAKTDLHNQIVPLREQQRLNREEFEVLKKTGEVAGRALNQNKDNEKVSEGNEGEDRAAGPKE